MPKGMMLKSDGFASDIYAPQGEFSLKDFCAERRIEYSDRGSPVSLDTFTAYGLAFQERMVPELENRLVVDLDRSPNGFFLRLDDGEVVEARRVVLAVGIAHFDYVPENLAHLPPEFFSHSVSHHDLTPFRGRSVTVIGGGASAIDLAGLLHEAGAEVQLVARRNSLRFHRAPTGKPRSLWQRIRHPQSELGPGLRSRFFSNSPKVFHSLPEGLRLWAVRTHLGPSAGWSVKQKVVGKVPLLLGYSVKGAEVQNGKVSLSLCGPGGVERKILSDHVIAATGYKVDLARLTFLNAKLRPMIKSVQSTPVLSSTFESSVPGLYFVGIAAANSFGPLMRFAFGACFAARCLTRAIEKSLEREPVSVPSGSAEPPQPTVYVEAARNDEMQSTLR
jgi:thioredoxin reductase